MKIAFFHEGPLFRNSDGAVYNGIVINNEVVDRYRFLGERLTVVTRINDENLENGTLIDRDGVEFVEVPHLYASLKSRLTKTRE